MNPFSDRVARRIALAALGGLLTLAPLTGHSLPSDRSKPLSFDADTMELDEKHGTTTLQGEVVIEQGSMRIIADTVVLHTRDDKISRVVAIGQPARYQQIPQQNQQPVKAEARRLEYHIDQEVLQLIDDASLVQEGTSLSGNRIDYDVRKAIVKAGSESSDNGDKRRVRMVIPPKAIKNTDEGTGDPEQAAPDNPPAQETDDPDA